MENKQSIYVNAAGPEVVIRTGEALDPKNHSAPSIKIDGTLGAPFQFLAGKAAIAVDEDIHLIIDNEKGQLKLVAKDKDPYTTHTVTGTLARNSDLDLFGINVEGRFWGVREFRKFLRMVKVHFDDPSVAGNLIEQLNKFESDVQKLYKDHNSDDGNTLLQLETKVSKSSLTTRTFKLNIQLYKGYPKVQFKVDIGFEATAQAIMLYLISEDLYALEVTERERIMQTELAKFSERTFSKIVVS